MTEQVKEQGFDKTKWAVLVHAIWSHYESNPVFESHANRENASQLAYHELSETDQASILAVADKFLSFHFKGEEDAVLEVSADGVVEQEAVEDVVVSDPTSVEPEVEVVEEVAVADETPDVDESAVHSVDPAADSPSDPVGTPNTPSE